MSEAGRTFLSDNAFGASPEVLEAVTAVAVGDAAPYGADPLTEAVRHRLRELFERDLDVFLVSSGTAANGLALATLAQPWGSVLCHPDSHIDNDEGGAAEFFTGGSKLVGVPGADSKIDPDALLRALGRRTEDPHGVRPSALSISQGTESGSVYTLDELGALCRDARAVGLGVHMDGARFANALSRLGATPAEMTWKAGVDVLSFGTTKNGTISADAVVSFTPAASHELRARVKRAGQLAAKTRFSAAQLQAYLADDLWLRNASRANTLATRLWEGLQGLPGVVPHGAPETNMVFCGLTPSVVKGLLAQGYAFYHDRWEPGVVRFVTSFAHSAAEVDGLTAEIGRLSREGADRPGARRPRHRDESWDHCLWA
ncbi:threonine aldolase family protein [Streptacidiphilus neutrinimicus]|uniref:threonine aldolase family protein n=1 Tax=Streptacidiphilus neutrinimicus TaxID=105420 RepID=UPI0007C7A4AF|nr:low specificity L-threonine aldolase [Streptacidiphilus neutrinimicus]